MNIPGVTDTASSFQSTKPAPSATDSKPVISTDYQMFLKMLTAQMKNQDPLKPIDSTDYATQLATFSGVEQQVKTNQLLASLTGQLGVSGMSQVANWVGMEARAPVSALFTGQPITLYPSPAKDADKAVLVAYDAQGREVTRQDITVSFDPIQWTGTSASGGQALHGSYTFKLESYTADKLTRSTTIDVYSRIKEARLTDSGAVLLMEGGDTVAPNNIKALRP